MEQAMDIRQELESRKEGVVFIDHPKGWDRLVEKLHITLMAIDPLYTIDQTKEKFGGLRFYARCNANADAFNAAIWLAESLSYSICDVCGKMAQFRDDLGWYRTLCDEHYEERKARNKNTAD